jgi:copper transport protein
MKRVPAGRHHRTRGFSLTVILALLSFGAVSAFAHGGLKSSQPGRGEVVTSSLREIRLNFVEPPELAVTSVRLTNDRGAVIDLSRPSLVGNSLVVPLSRALLAGRYHVAWKSAGRDGHPVSGDFFFQVATETVSPSATAPLPKPLKVGEPIAPMEMHHDTLSLPSAEGFNAGSPAYVAIRFVQFAALVILLGAVAFWHVVLRLLRSRNDKAPLLIATTGRHQRIAIAAAALLLLVGLVRLIAQSYAMHSADESVFGPMIPMITGTLWGIGWLMQIVGAVFVIVGLLVMRSRNTAWNIATVGALALAFSPALSGHAASAPRLGTIAVLSDGLHIIGAGGWLGSLFFVVAVGLPAALTVDENERSDAVASLVNAFSPTALAFAGLAAITGVFAGWLHIGSIRGLFETEYGRMLMLKLGIISLVAATGAYNWLRVGPALGKTRGTIILGRTGGAELVIAVFVLAVTAVLVATPTAIDEEMMKPTASTLHLE